MTALGLCCCVRAFSSCSEWQRLPSCGVQTSHCRVARVAERGFQVHGLQSLWLMGLSAPQHVESSLTRDGTHVSCIGRRILYHWTTREVPRGFN